jgi:hypothetical protein
MHVAMGDRHLKWHMFVCLDAWFDAVMPKKVLVIGYRANVSCAGHSAHGLW